MTVFWFRFHKHQISLAVIILVATIFYFAQYLRMLSPQPHSLEAVLPTVFTGSNPNVDLNWHAPKSTQINDLSSVLDGKGTYGFIYDSSWTPDDAYGTYNWCNMPHARVREYNKPADKFELKYVEVVSGMAIL